VLPVGMPGIHCQQGEVSDETQSFHRVSWLQYGAKPSIKFKQRLEN